MNNFTLYELSNQYQSIYNTLLDEEQITDEELTDAMSGITGEIQDKGIQIGVIIKNLNCFVDGMEKEKDNIMKRISATKNKISNIKKYILDNMEKCNIKKITGKNFNLLVKNCPESVVIQDLVSLPEKYFRVKIITEPDKKLILNDLKNGEIIDGAKVVRNKTLLIN